MTELHRYMASFNDELEKQANTISTIGLRALEAAVGGLKASGGVAKRFGQRQAHGLTGWTPKGYMNPQGIREMRAGAYDTAERLSAAERAVAPGPGRYRPGLVDRALGRKPEAVQAKKMQSAKSELEQARKAHEASQTAEDMGLTSLPGYAKALLNDPTKALKAGIGEQWHSMGPAGRSLMVGIPAAGMASEAMRPGDPGEAGRFARAGARAGELAYTMGPLPFSGQIVAGLGVGSLGKRMGSIFDKKKPVKNIPAPPTLEPAGGEAAPADTIVSERALGASQGGFL